MNWTIVAVLLAGTAVSVVAQWCKRDVHCPPAGTRCCTAANLDQALGMGTCKPLGGFGATCGNHTFNDKSLFACKCADGFRCEVLPAYRNSDKFYYYMRCNFADDVPGSGAGLEEEDDDTEKEEEEEEPNYGPGGEPPRNDDCEDWEKPC